MRRKVLQLLNTLMVVKIRVGCMSCQMAWGRVRNGLFLFTLRNYLTRFGLDIAPYYWESEGLDCKELKIKGDLGDYEVVHIKAEEIGITHGLMGLDSDELKEEIRNGQLCMGLKYQNEIAAVVFAGFNDFTFKHRFFELKNNQAYISNLYTFEAHRGKNLAPFLRYQSYKVLKEKGVDEIFSITSYFNTSSLRANKKMGIEHLRLFLHIGLFKRFHWNYILRRY